MTEQYAKKLLDAIANARGICLYIHEFIYPYPPVVGHGFQLMSVIDHGSCVERSSCYILKTSEDSKSLLNAIRARIEIEVSPEDAVSFRKEKWLHMLKFLLECAQCNDVLFYCDDEEHVLIRKGTALEELQVMADLSI